MLELMARATGGSRSRADARGAGEEPATMTPVDDHNRKACGMLTLDEAMSLCTAARDAATQLEAPPMSFAVMDAGGHLLAFARMDRAPWVSADVALGKAWTSAAYGVPSAAQKEKMAPTPSFATAIITMTHGRFTPQTGAVPIYRGGVLLGALGASGGTGEQDQDMCARAVSATGFSTSS
jgi:uncharacterized protein GlcG (DUF336 family)